MPDVMLLGPVPLTRPLATALQRMGLHVARLGPAKAARSLGALLDARLLIFGWPPGTHPQLETEAYTARTAILHAWWTTAAASVGPVVLKGLGPCPSCLSGGPTRYRPGGPSALGDWVVATAALEAQAALRNAMTALAGASLTWTSDQPGLTVTPWRRRLTCQGVECGSASPLMFPDHG